MPGRDETDTYLLMTRTYLVAINDNSGADPQDIAADIQESLQLDGFVIESVRPWASPNESPQMSSLINPLSSEFTHSTNFGA